MQGRTQEFYWYKGPRNSAQSSFSLANIIPPTKQGNNGFSLDRRHTSSEVDRFWEDREIHYGSGVFVLNWIESSSSTLLSPNARLFDLHPKPLQKKSCQRLLAHLHCSNRVSSSWQFTRTTFPFAVHWKPFKKHSPIWLDNRITDRKNIMGNRQVSK